MPTGRQIVTHALKEIGVLRSGGVPTAEDAADALSRLNRWIDSLGLKRFSMQTRLRTVEALVAGTASYTIGTGGDINIARPIRIEEASLILDSTATSPVESPLEVWFDDDWAGVSQKTLPGDPAGIYFDRAWSSGLGRIYVSPVTNGSNRQLVIYTPLAVTQFADLSTAYSLPTGYEELFVMNLAVLLAPLFGVVPSGVTVRAAEEAKEGVAIANFQVPELQPATSGLSDTEMYHFDIRSGGFR